MIYTVSYWFKDRKIDQWGMITGLETDLGIYVNSLYHKASIADQWAKKKKKRKRLFNKLY